MWLIWVAQAKALDHHHHVAELGLCLRHGPDDIVQALVHRLKLGFVGEALSVNVDGSTRNTPQIVAAGVNERSQEVRNNTNLQHLGIHDLQIRGPPKVVVERPQLLLGDRCSMAAAAPHLSVLNHIARRLLDQAGSPLLVGLLVNVVVDHPGPCATKVLSSPCTLITCEGAPFRETSRLQVAVQFKHERAQASLELRSTILW